jgi:predicted alpha/beta hydrolase
MGAQCAYRKDYAEKGRLKMLAKWHVAMPVLTSVYGYFPGKRLGWLEDTPRGVVRDWTNSRQHFEDTWRGRHAARHPSMAMLVERFASVTAPTLAVSVTDDEFGTVPAIERLLAYYKRSLRLHLRISPDSIDEPAIGHFGFFNSKFQQKLWGLPVNWLKTGQLPDPYPGTVVGEHAAPSPAPRVKEPL